MTAPNLDLGVLRDVYNEPFCFVCGMTLRAGKCPVCDGPRPPRIGKPVDVATSRRHRGLTVTTVTYRGTLLGVMGRAAAMASPITTAAGKKARWHKAHPFIGVLVLWVAWCLAALVFTVATVVLCLVWAGATIAERRRTPSPAVAATEPPDFTLDDPATPHDNH